MLAIGPAKKVTIHLNEDTSATQDYLYKEIFAFLLEHGIAGATLLRPQAGFGAHHRAHTAHAAGAAGEHLPVRIEFIEQRERVDRLLPSLIELVSDGLIEAHDTVVLKAAARHDR